MKKLLSLVLSFALVCAMMTAAAPSAKAAAVHVTDEAELTAALAANEPLITLDNDIAITSTLFLSADATLTGAGATKLYSTSWTFTLINTGSFDLELEGLWITGGSTAIYANTGAVTAQNCKFTANAGSNGAVVLSSCGNVTMTGCQIGGLSGDGNGTGATGAISLYGTGSASFTDCAFEGNWGTSVGGGGIYAYTITSLTCTGCTFTSNTGENGSAVSSCAATTTITNCTFTTNAAATAGALYVSGTGAATVTDCTFTGNTAVGGGAITVGETAADTVTLTVNGGTYSGNTASWAGGAIYDRCAGDITLNGVTFQNNTASSDGGAIKCDQAASITADHCTFTNNNGGSVDTAVTLNTGTFTGTYCIFTGNSADPVYPPENASLTGPDAQVFGHSMTLEGQIGMNTYLVLSSAVIADSSDYRVEFWDGATLVDSKLVSAVTPATKYRDATPYTVFGFPLTTVAKDYDKTFTMKIKNISADAYVDFYDNLGAAVDGDAGYDYSLAACLTEAQSTGSAGMRQLAKNMTAYCAYAKHYFAVRDQGYAGARPEAAGFTPVTAGDLSGFAYTVPSNIDHFTFRYTTLVLENETSFRLYFESDDVSALSITCGGNALDVRTAHGLYYVAVENIAAQDLDELYDITIDNGAATATAHHGPMGYAYWALSASSDENLQYAMMALYRYNQAAEAYFADPDPVDLSRTIVPLAPGEQGVRLADKSYLARLDFSYLRTADEFYIRDPFVILCDGVYFMYGSNIISPVIGDRGFSCYASTDLVHWSGAYDVTAPAIDWTGYDYFWAPEVYYYNDAFYMLVTYRNQSTGVLGCATLRADNPLGPFERISDEFFTSGSFDLDATLYIDPEGQPWCLYALDDVTIVAAKFSDDLTELISDPVPLFSVAGLGWATTSVCEAPYIYTMSSGSLCMLWAGADSGGYIVGTATASSVTGPWTVQDARLYNRANSPTNENGGHAMTFLTRDGTLMITFHAPNDPDYEHGLMETARFYPVVEDPGAGVLVMRDALV